MSGDVCSEGLGHDYAATLSALWVGETKGAKKAGRLEYSTNLRIQCRECGKTLRGVTMTTGYLVPSELDGWEWERPKPDDPDRWWV